MMESPIFRVFLTVTPLLSATLYLMGLSYHEGLLGEFGLESSLFPLPSDRALLQGFFILIILSFEPILNALLIILLLIVLLVIVVLLTLNPSFKKIQEKVSPHLQNKMPSKEASKVIDNGAMSMAYISGVFFMILIPFSIAYLSLQTGSKHAQEKINRFEDSTGSWVMLYEKGSSTPLKASEIMCSTQHCAFWTGDRSVVLSHENIKKTVVHKKVARNEKSK